MENSVSNINDIIQEEGPPETGARNRVVEVPPLSQHIEQQ